MSCSAYQELLSAQVDGELSPRERRRLADHVAGCEPCREQHDSLVALKREIASSISGTDEIDRRQLRQVMARHGRRAQRVRIAAAAIAAGVVLCCAAWLLTSSRARAPRFRASSHPLGFVPPPRMPDHPVAEASSRPILVSAAGQLVRVAPGRPGLEQLTLPPAGASDMRPVVSPDGRHVLFERRSADRRQLWVLDLTTGTTRPAVVGRPDLDSWSGRFLCNNRIRLIADSRRLRDRSHLSAAEHDIALTRKAAGGRGGLGSRGAAHLWRVPTSWSQDGCVSTRLVHERTDDKLLLSLQVRSCRGGVDQRGRRRRRYAETARWPAVIENNVRQTIVSPDGRYIAVTLDRGPVLRSRPGRARPALLYVIEVASGSRRGRRRPTPSHPLEGESPAPMRMPALSNFLLWQRVASSIVGSPRWSGDSSSLCFIREQRGSRGAWCWAAATYRSRQLGPNDSRLLHAAPDSRGQRVLLTRGPTARRAASLAIFDARSGRQRSVKIERLDPASPPVWLPPFSRGSPCPD